MAAYYLVAQLPSLDGLGERAPLPITEERFLQLCQSLLSKKAQRGLRWLTLAPPRRLESTGLALVDAWNAGERKLRLALGKVRDFPAEMLKAARTAADMENPMAAEHFLCSYRLAFLDTLRPMDPFSEDAVFYYGLKLKLMARMRQFDAQAGREAYQNIYDSILRKERLEVLS